MATRMASKMWAVMVGDRMFGGSLSTKREWAETYLGDARHFVAQYETSFQRPAPKVRLVEVTIRTARAKKARA